MRLLDRRDKRTKLAIMRNVPEVVRQDYYRPAELELNGKRWWSTCIGCVEPKCMRYYDNEYICPDIKDFPADPNDLVCPVSAMSWDDDSVRPIIDYNKCIACGLCANRCPIGAIYFDEDSNAVLISEDKNAIFKPIDAKNKAEQQATLKKVESICWQHHFREADDYDLDDVYSAISIFDGRSPVHNILVRNLLISLGYNCSTSRTGDIYTRMDAVYSDNTCRGAVEIEFGRDTLEASRGILDDIATMQTHHGIDKSCNKALVVCLSFPNKRQGYFQVIKDIKNVLGLNIQTLSLGALLILAWDGKKVDFSENRFCTDFDNMSIRDAVNEYLGRKVEITEGYLGILEPEK